MKKIIVGLLLAAMTFSFAGCSGVEVSVNTDNEQQSGEVNEVEENYEDEVLEEPEDMLGDYPSNEFEERVNKFSFDSYDEIIDLLEGGEAYAYVDLLGYDEPVLLVTSYTFDNLDGNRAAIDATPYFKYPDGYVKAGSILVSGSTATPLAMADDGCIVVATHNTVQKFCVGENGTDIPGLMVMKYVYATYDPDTLEVESYGGFVRDKNTVIDNDGVEIASDDEKAYKDAFAEYEECKVIGFTVADPSAVEISEEEFNPASIAGSYVRFNVENIEGTDADEYCIIDERIIISEDGSAVYSNQDSISYTVTATAFTGESGDIPYSFSDGCIIFGENADVFVKSDREVSADEEDILKAREDYMYPSEENTRIKPGNYVSKNAPEYEDSDGIWNVWLIVREDGSAFTLYQDFGPMFDELAAGKNIGKNGEECNCIVSNDCIALSLDDVYTVFVRTDEEYKEGEPEF